jgi:hypothetical protein
MSRDNGSYYGEYTKHYIDYDITSTEDMVEHYTDYNISSMEDMVEHYTDYNSTSMHDMVELYIDNAYPSMDDKMDHDIDTTIGIMQGEEVTHHYNMHFKSDIDKLVASDEATSRSPSCSRWHHKKSAHTHDHHHREHHMEHQDPHRHSSSSSRRSPMQKSQGA